MGGCSKQYDLLQNAGVTEHEKSRCDLISCHCAVRLLYLGGLGISALIAIRRVLLHSSHSYPHFGMRHVKHSCFVCYLKPEGTFGPCILIFCLLFNRLFKQAVPWPCPLTCMTETCLVQNCVCPPHPWEMARFFPGFYSHFIYECKYLLSFLYMNLPDFSVNFWLLSCTVRVKSLFWT